jgi:ribosome-associated protein
LHGRNQLFLAENIDVIFMMMKEFDLDGHEFIELNKLLKLMKMVGSGGEANGRIENGEVMVNGLVETRKRNKLRAGDIVLFQESSVLIR